MTNNSIYYNLSDKEVQALDHLLSQTVTVLDDANYPHLFKAYTTKLLEMQAASIAALMYLHGQTPLQPEEFKAYIERLSFAIYDLEIFDFGQYVKVAFEIFRKSADVESYGKFLLALDAVKNIGSMIIINAYPYHTLNHPDGNYTAFSRALDALSRFFYCTQHTPLYMRLNGCAC